MKGLLKVAGVIGLGLALSVSTAEAQAKFIIGGGSSLALGSTGDVLNNGPHGVLGVEFAPKGSPVAIRVDGMFHIINADAAAETAIDLDKAQVINGTLNAVYNFKVAETSKVRPYLIAGVGYYNTKLKFTDATPDASSSDFGFNGGAGFDIKAGEKLGIFIEGRYHNILVSDASDTKVLTVSAGARVGI